MDHIVLVYSDKLVFGSIKGEGKDIYVLFMFRGGRRGQGYFWNIVFLDTFDILIQNIKIHLSCAFFDVWKCQECYV